MLTSAAAKSKPRPAASPDAQFANKAAEGNLARVALEQIAPQKAQSDDVKKFAERRVDDHQKAEQDLEGIASKNNLTLGKTVNAQQQAEHQRLQKLSGAALDRAYMQMMVKDHTKDVAEFKKEANSTARNSDLRDYKAYLPDAQRPSHQCEIDQPHAEQVGCEQWEESGEEEQLNHPRFVNRLKA